MPADNPVRGPRPDASQSERVRSIAGRLPLCHASIRSAFEAGEFDLAYQAIVNVHDGRPSGCEVLLRWDHPLRGAQAPDQFVAILARSRLVLEVGDWVLAQAAAQTLAWSRAYGRDLRLSMNVAPLQIREPDFPKRLRRILEASGLPAERLSLEITNQALDESCDAAGTALARIALLGVEIHLDDFNGGPSALSKLQAMALTGFKLDRRFMKGLASGQVSRTELRTLTSLAEGLGLRVIAKGIEGEADLALAADLGLTEVQGFLFCPPLPAAAFGNYLSVQVVRGD